jgi:hypothetical protein
MAPGAPEREAIRLAWQGLTGAPGEVAIEELVAARLWPVAGGAPDDGQPGGQPGGDGGGGAAGAGDGGSSAAGGGGASTDAGGLQQLADGKAAVDPEGSGPSTPGAEGAQAGGEQGAGEGEGPDAIALLRQQLEAQGLDPAAVAAVLLEAVPEDKRGEIPHLRSAEERGAQRERTQLGEVEKATREREEAYQALEQQGARAEAYVGDVITRHTRLLQRAQAAERDQDAEEAARLRGEAQRLIEGPRLAKAVVDYGAGEVAKTARERATQFDQLREKHKAALGELTDEEQARFREARRKDAQTDGLHQVEVLLDLLADRVAAKAEAKGAEKGAKAAATSGQQLELVRSIAEALKLAPPAVNGKRPASAAGERAAIQAEIDAVDVYTDPQAREKLDKLEQRLRALPA